MSCRKVCETIQTKLSSCSLKPGPRKLVKKLERYRKVQGHKSLSWSLSGRMLERISVKSEKTKTWPYVTSLQPVSIMSQCKRMAVRRIEWRGTPSRWRPTAKMTHYLGDGTRIIYKADSSHSEDRSLNSKEQSSEWMWREKCTFKARMRSGWWTIQDSGDGTKGSN